MSKCTPRAAGASKTEEQGELRVRHSSGGSTDSTDLGVTVSEQLRASSLLTQDSGGLVRSAPPGTSLSRRGHITENKECSLVA